MALSARDTTFTTDIEQYFRQAMLSEGIEPDRVQIDTYREDQFTNEKFLIQVGKEINGELRTIKTGLTVSASDPTDRIRNQLAMAAHDAAVEFEDAMVEMIAPVDLGSVGASVEATERFKYLRCLTSFTNCGHIAKLDKALGFEPRDFRVQVLVCPYAG